MLLDSDVLYSGGPLRLTVNADNGSGHPFTRIQVHLRLALQLALWLGGQLGTGPSTRESQAGQGSKHAARGSTLLSLCTWRGSSPEITACWPAQALV